MRHADEVQTDGRPRPQVARQRRRSRPFICSSVSGGLVPSLLTAGPVKHQTSDLLWNHQGTFDLVSRVRMDVPIMGCAVGLKNLGAVV